MQEEFIELTNSSSDKDIHETQDLVTFWLAMRNNYPQRGGVALIHKNTIELKRNTTLNFTQFEHMKCTATCDNISIQIIVIYRPPPSQQNQFNTSTFLEEFADFLSQAITTSSEVIITETLIFILSIQDIAYS